ncbi:MAG: TrmH family RNA methyltransferase [Terracidiphilus sp.]
MKQLRRVLAQAHPLPGGDGRLLAGIEGPHLLREALRAGLRIDCVFVAQDAEGLLQEFPLPASSEVMLVPRPLLDQALATETPQPLAALIEPPCWRWEDILASRPHAEPLFIVLTGLQDPGNLGTILRSAEAFGARAVLSLPGTVSAWNPKAVRASAGSLFRLPVIALRTEDCFARLRAAHVKIWTTAASAAEPADRVCLAGPVALLIGNEGNGVPQPLARAADGALRIPCPGAVESLNAAVAASVLLYEAARQRSGRGARTHRGRPSDR